ncbi:MAG: DUF4249 family protein [Bacteroidales bacterium]|nr:DUF4249 family protein [Bacteroidales bacterium]
MICHSYIKLSQNTLKKAKTGILYVLVTGLILLSSCTERIEIELEDDFARLVVEGAITTDTMPHTIKLTTTSSYYYNQPAPVVQHAIVSISDGTETFLLNETAPRGSTRRLRMFMDSLAAPIRFPFNWLKQ